MSLVVKAKIKEAVGDLNVSSDFADTLDKKVAELVKSACDRAISNNRRTVMAKDL
jgi:histone H3/H4